jgi:ABC-type nitrate/sulfonate/bicarbonate transport system ATPase subunit
MALIELQDVDKSFVTGRSVTRVLRGVALRVEEGELVAIVGFSGTGKTTLISLLAGLLQPDAGTVKVDGRLVRGADPERALVFQSYALLPWLDVVGNVRLAVDAVFPDWSRGGGGAPATPPLPPATTSRGSGWPAPRTSGPASCPAACASASRWPARWR